MSSSSATPPRTHRWGCGRCLDGIPPSYMAQFQVTKRMVFGPDSTAGLTREGKRDLIMSRIRATLRSIPSKPSLPLSQAFRSKEEFADGQAGPNLTASLCPQCFQFAFMIPPQTFEDCLKTVLNQEPGLAGKFSATASTSASSSSSSLSSLGSRGYGTAAANVGATTTAAAAAASAAVGDSSAKPPAAASAPASASAAAPASAVPPLFGLSSWFRAGSAGEAGPPVPAPAPWSSRPPSDATSVHTPTPPPSLPPPSLSPLPTPPPPPPQQQPQQQQARQVRADEGTPLLAAPGPAGDASSSSSKDKTLGAALIDFLLYGPPPPAKTKVPFEWWHAWDVAANCKEIFIRQREGDLAFLDGIRAIAYLWVLGDHLYQALTAEMTGFIAWWQALGTAGNEFQVLSNGNKGDQGVTSFFFLSGFLIPFIFSRMVKGAAKESQLLGTPEPVFSFHAWEFLFRRFARLAPTLYAGTLVAFLYGYSMRNISTSSAETFYYPCQQYWWQNIVFINNFSGIAGWETCYDSVWTISVEYQLYILTVPIVFFYVWKETYGRLAAVVFTVVTVIVRIAVTAWCDDTGAEYGAWVYLPSWTRAPEYGVGMLCFMLYEHYYASPKKRAEIKPLAILDARELAVRVSFQAFIFGVLAFGLYYVAAGDEWWAFSYQQYESFSYLLWGLTIFAVAQVTFENVLWPVKWILSWYFWYPIAQLAYTGGVLNMVICHGMATLIMSVSGSATWDDDTTVGAYFIIFVAAALLSLLFGLVLSLLVERPFMNLAKQVPAFYKLFSSKAPLTSDVTAASLGGP